MSSRTRKLEFIASFPERFGLEDAILKLVRRKGADWLTDEQIADIVALKLRDSRSARRDAAHNRAIATANRRAA